MKTDLYNKVTDQIVAALERGVRPWMKPWSAAHRATSTALRRQSWFAVDSPLEESGFELLVPVASTHD